MFETAAYPSVSALLVKLLQLDPADAGLGLEILVNLHPMQLQAPLLGLAKEIKPLDWRADHGLRTPELLAVLAENALFNLYPALSSSAIFHSSEALQAIQDNDTHRGGGIEFATALHKVSKDELAIHLCYQSRKGWRTYDHLVLLHRLGWDATNRDYLLNALEIELSISPAVRQSVLALAHG